MSNICSVTISSPPRGIAPGAAAVFTPAEVVLTHSWGLQPSTALIEWVTQGIPGDLVAGSTIEIDLGEFTFYGVTDNFVERVASDGFSVLQEFRDNREFLMWDVIYGAFNIHENKYLNGVYVKRYKHLLPANFNANAWLWTDEPLTADQILEYIFQASTVQSPWLRSYHPLMANAVFDLDFSGGRKLGQCLVDISEKLGLVFALSGGPYSLVWALKGTGVLPGFPAASDNRRSGSALSGNPTRVRILGDRNRYQIFNCPMQPDWLAAWQPFWDFGQFVDDIFLNEVTDTPLLAGATGEYVPQGTPYAEVPNDPDHVVGYALAGARARLLTVGQYADLRDMRVSNDGNAFRDTRRYQGRSRMQLPVALYLSQLLFRAFKLADNFSFVASNGAVITRFGFDLEPQALVEVTHDPVSGWMSPVTAGSGYQVPTSASNGYAVIQGYQVGQDAFGSLNPGYFDYQSWITAQQLWQYAAFQTDDSGEGDQFILFDQPVINSGSLIAAAFNPLPDGRARGVLTAAPTFNVPAVSAVLTVQGEKFSYLQGLGTRDDVENISDLAGQFLILQPGQPTMELPFADGLTARQKAAQYASLLLNGQLTYRAGGYLLAGMDDGVDLSGAVDRVTLRWNARDGLTKEVDWENERSRNVSIGFRGVPTLMLEPEREFDRKSQLDPLYPGQEQLRTEARQLKLSAAILRSNPRMQQDLVDTFHRLMGLDSPTQLVLTDSATGGAPTLPVGTPLYRDPTGNVAITPNDASPVAHPGAVFLGVTTLDGQSAGAGVRATATGAGGVVQARVLGPVTAGDPVGFGGTCVTYLQTGPTTQLGTAAETVPGMGIVLIRVRVGSGGAGGSFRGEWSPTATYGVQDEVVIRSGPNAGSYVCIQTNNGQAPQLPDTGNLYWISLSGNAPALGAWMT